MQNIRGASQAPQPEYADHHLRHQSIVRFFGSSELKRYFFSACHRYLIAGPKFTVGRFELLGVPEVDKHVRSVQQRMDQGENLRATTTSGWHHR